MHRLFGFALVAVCGATAACIDDAGAGEAGEEETSSARLAPTWLEWPMSGHGGNGGAYVGYAIPRGSIIRGVRVRSGDVIDSISFNWYQPTRNDNWPSPFDAQGVWTFGGGGGGDNGWWYCPAGKGVIGIFGDAGTYLHRFGVMCGDVNAPDPNNPLNPRSPVWGGINYSWFEDRCGPGALIDTVNLRAGGYIDFIQGVCLLAH